jgi:hypothetical protein
VAATDHATQQSASIGGTRRIRCYGSDAQVASCFARIAAAELE